jgi:phosphoribosylanthranilate isomerase
MTARRIGIKICGLTKPADVDACVRHGADWIGLVFHPASPRYVTPDAAASLCRAAPSHAAGGPRRVALLVRPDDALVDAVCDILQPDILQLYGSPERITAIGRRTGLPIWAAIGISEKSDLPRTADTQGLVIEAKAPREAGRPGGNGLTFDWSILTGWHAPAPWLLAGGLTPDNVADALRASGAPAVDVSSGVETAPGEKSPALIARFIDEARRHLNPLA